MQVTIMVSKGANAVTTFQKGEELSIVTEAYTGQTNVWLHVSKGTIVPADAASHKQATACTQAGFSSTPAASHEFTWTALWPAQSDAACATITVAQAVGAGDIYNTASVRSPLSW